MIRGLLLFCLIWSVTASPAQARSEATSQPKDQFFCGTYPGRVKDDLRKYKDMRLVREALSKRTALLARLGSTQDINNIAVIEDDGTMVTPFNFFDLKGKAIRLAPVAVTGSYRVSIRQAEISTNMGTLLKLADDDTREVVFNGTFHFPFFGGLYSSVFINSDGNITFIHGDADSTDRDLGRLNDGPPRIAPFLTDLDPSTGIGGIYVNQLSDRVTITWSAVREWNTFKENTFQVSLYPDGSIEFIFGQVTTTKGIAGWSGGNQLLPLDIIDLSAQEGSVLSGPSAERYSVQTEVDLSAVSKAFYKTHPDNYDQLVMYTNFPWELGSNEFAFEENIKNDVSGIGLGIFDFSSQFGSSGGLLSFLAMNQLSAYPDDPDAVFLGTNSTINLLGHETGHRWLSYVRLGLEKSGALLGRDEQHWSFFFNSGASVMEGNEIRDNGDGTFTTTAATDRYGPLDQYLMGFLDPNAVGPLFYVSDVSGTSQTSASPPALGVTFRGTRQTFMIDDVMVAEGPRVPDASLAPKVFHQGFILLIPQGTTPPQADLDKITAIRQRWQQFFSDATNGNGTVDTTLSTIPLVPNVQNISPATGSTLGNTDIAISGTNFQPGVAVKIGASKAANVVFVSSSLITATTPAGAAGTASVTIANPDAPATILPGGFTYLTLDTPRVSASALRIPVAKDTLTYRSNLGINNPNPVPASVWVMELDKNGLLLNQLKAFPVPANGYVQKNSILRELEGVSALTGREASLVLESDQPIQAYLSLIDNLTEDASVLDGVRSGSSQLILLSSANTGPFQSNLSIVNLSPYSTNVTITSLNRENGQPQGTPLRNLPLGSNGHLAFDNILESLSLADSFGPIEIHSDNGAALTAVSQVSGLNKGTSGFFPSISRDSGTLSEIIPFVIDTDTFRTNLGLNNLGTETAAVQISLLGGDGKLMGSTSTAIQVGPLGLVQINNIIRYVMTGSSSSGVTQKQGYLKITSNQPMKAFATQIDNLTNDPSIEVSVSHGDPHLLLKSSSALNFQSTMAVVNPNDKAVDVQFVARQGADTENGQIVGTRTVTIPAQGSVSSENLIQFIGSTANYGPVEIQSLDGRPIIAVSRVYSTAQRTSGFFAAQPIP
ncbi:MAG: IPT/TIG domain-containing protein [Terriglobia bacterium]